MIQAFFFVPVEMNLTVVHGHVRLALSFSNFGSARVDLVVLRVELPVQEVGDSPGNPSTARAWVESWRDDQLGILGRDLVLAGVGLVALGFQDVRDIETSNTRSSN